MVDTIRMIGFLFEVTMKSEIMSLNIIWIRRVLEVY